MSPRARRVVVGIVAATNLVITGYAGYGLYTRAGAPEFSRGGTFGERPKEASEATRRSGNHARPDRAARGRKDRSGPAEAKDARISPSTGALGIIQLPREGTYRYDSSGHEQVHFGFASVCSWDLDGSHAVVKHDDGNVVFDWTYREGRREERHIDDFRKDGVYTVFVGAAVTCAGQRQTNEDRYDPPPLRVPSPLRVGYRWTVDTNTESRRERVSGEVLARRTISVPAGRFDAFQLRETGTVSHGQEGTFKTTFWYAPSLSVIIRQTSKVDVKDGEAHFESDTSLALAALP